MLLMCFYVMLMTHYVGFIAFLLFLIHKLKDKNVGIGLLSYPIIKV